MNQCDHGHETGQEVRLLPCGSGNIILCRIHYDQEMRFRGELFPRWEDLKVYDI